MVEYDNPSKLFYMRGRSTLLPIAAIKQDHPRREDAAKRLLEEKSIVELFPSLAARSHPFMY